MVLFIWVERLFFKPLFANIQMYVEAKTDDLYLRH